MSKNVLLIVTSHAQLGDTGRQTGLYLSEFAHPYEVFSQAGFGITVASPQGGDAVDRRACPMNNGLTCNTPEHAAVESIGGEIRCVLRGRGHGTMWDLPGTPIAAHLAARVFAGQALAAVVMVGGAGH